jgi:hypothetical protein
MQKNVIAKGKNHHFLHPNKLSQKGNKTARSTGGKYGKIWNCFSVTSKKKLGQEEKYYIVSSQAYIKEAI